MRHVYTVCCRYIYKSTLTVPVCPISLCLSERSKVLCRWLASLPMQLSQLGHRNPALSAQIITSIQAAASRGHKDLLNSLQTCACTIYGMNSIYLIAHFCHDLNHLYLQCLYYFFRNRYLRLHILILSIF